MQIDRTGGESRRRDDIRGFVDQITRRVNAFRNGGRRFVCVLGGLGVGGHDVKLFQRNGLFLNGFVFQKPVGGQLRPESDFVGGQIVNGEIRRFFSAGQQSVDGRRSGGDGGGFAHLFLASQTDAHQTFDGQRFGGDFDEQIAAFARETVRL